MANTAETALILKNFITNLYSRDKA
jgi:hypothetical protein